MIAGFETPAAGGIYLGGRDVTALPDAKFGVIDHVGRALCYDDAAPVHKGWGLFEHGALGRHDPSGFVDWLAVSPCPEVCMAVDRWVFGRDTVEFARALNLIDAIFGFSLTLLVTSLDVPPADAWVSPQALLDTGLGAQLLAFFISFVVVVGFWVSNHQALSSFRALDSATIRVCIYLVALVIFVPFTTKVISGHDPANLPLPTAVYAANVAAIVLLTVALILVGQARGLSDRTPRSTELIAHSLAVGAVFLVSIPIAYRFGPDAAKWSWLSLVVLTPLVGRLVGRRQTG